jgi:hypothetical protein
MTKVNKENDMSIESSEMSQGIELHEQNSAIVQPGETRLPFAVAGSNGAGVAQEQIERIMKSQKLDFDMKGDYWSPEMPGERKRLVFQYLVKGELIPNKYGADPDERIPVDTAYFVELYEENGAYKQRMLRSCAVVVVSFIERNNVPKHAVLDVEYKGKKKGERYNFDDFKFIPVPVQF